MKKYFVLITFSLITITNSFAQDLKCDDFKNGTFILTTPLFPELEWKIIRNDNKQIEIITKLPQKFIELGFPNDTINSEVKWVSRCSYILKRAKKSKISNLLENDFEEIIVDIKSIKGKCAYYTSKAIIDDKEVILEGKMCKVE